MLVWLESRGKKGSDNNISFLSGCVIGSLSIIVQSDGQTSSKWITCATFTKHKVPEDEILLNLLGLDCWDKIYIFSCGWRTPWEAARQQQDLRSNWKIAIFLRKWTLGNMQRKSGSCKINFTSAPKRVQGWAGSISNLSCPTHCTLSCKYSFISLKLFKPIWGWFKNI